MKDITSKIFKQISQHQLLQVVGPLVSKDLDINPNLPTVLIDGGAKLSKRPNLNWVIGDADGHINKDDFDILLDTDKDQSDLAFFLNQLKEFSTQSHLLLFFGFAGGRHDHDLFVLGDSIQFLENISSTIVLYEKSLILSSAPISFTLNGLFSVGSLSKNRITIQGECQYPLENFEMNSLSSRGLSNMAHGSVSIHADEPFWIFFEDKLAVKKIQNDQRKFEEFL